MSWADVLCETYDKCANRAGIPEENGSVLMPPFHLSIKSQITITINEDGNFIRAERNDKNDQETIIPVTEDSASRTSGISPMPFADKLIYVAGDYGDYAIPKGEDTKHSSKKDKSPEEYHQSYLKNLENWAAQSDAPVQVKAVYKYLSKDTVMKDLASCDIFGKNEKYDELVRFSVRRNIPGVQEDTWKDPEMYQAFERFEKRMREKSVGKKEGIDYITGEVVELTDKAPARLRYAGDSAKIISSNDKEGYTFRGRFDNSDQAAGIGYLSSQKLHNALRWLIARQGYRNGSEVIVTWRTNGGKVPPVLAGSEELFQGLESEPEEEITDLGERYAQKINKALKGYYSDIQSTEQISVMALDTADSSSKGRLSITYFQEIEGSVFLDRLRKWHKDCAWRLSYLSKYAGNSHLWIGAPSPKDIIRAAFGKEQKGTIIVEPEVEKKGIDRILPCIVQGRKIPLDIEKAAVQNASNPLRFSKANGTKIIEIACALIRKSEIDYQDKKEVKIMAVDPENKNRSYLFGRLLAVFRRAEESVLAKKEDSDKRLTAAERYWSAFTLQPAKTAAVIQERLNPYFRQMTPGGKYFYENQIGEIMDMLADVNGYTNQPLSEQYLLGYYNQYSELKRNKNSQAETAEEER